MRGLGLFQRRHLKTDFFGYLAVIYAASILVATRLIPKWGVWYSASPFHRRQSLAILHGHLALSRNPCDLDLDLCWSQGGVQQVWGLGVPLWRLPFDWIARLCGDFAFPDRLCLGLFIALTAYVVFMTWLGTGEGDRPTESSPIGRNWVAAGAVFLCLGFAPALNLLQTRMDHYYEVLAYVMCFGVMLLCGIASIATFPNWRKYWALAALAGFGGLIRPTLIFYGLATLCVAGLLVHRSDEGTANSEKSNFGPNQFGKLAVGVLLFAVGGSVLFVTNYVRFGSGWEFGHHLNVSPALPSVYSTRFDYPFKHVSLFTSARELFGSLFQISRFNGVDFYRQGIFDGQSEIVRARKFNYTTYDLSYFVAICLAWALGFYHTIKRIGSRKATAFPVRRSHSELGWAIIVWSVISSIPLIGLYLKTHAIGDRYMLDFAPAILADLIGIWVIVVESATASTKRPKMVLAYLLLILVVWQGYEVASAKSGWGGPQSCTGEDAEWATLSHAPPLGRLPDRYESRAAAALTGISYNGIGWSQDGGTACCGVFYVNNCQFLQLHLTPAAGTYGAGNVPAAGISAKIGLESLERESCYWTNGECVLKFAGPKRDQLRNGLQPAFVAFVSGADLQQYYSRQSPWLLKTVEWRE